MIGRVGGGSDARLTGARSPTSVSMFLIVTSLALIALGGITIASNTRNTQSSRSSDSPPSAARSQPIQLAAEPVQQSPPPNQGSATPPPIAQGAYQSAPVAAGISVAVTSLPTAPPNDPNAAGPPEGGYP